MAIIQCPNNVRVGAFARIYFSDMPSALPLQHGEEVEPIAPKHGSTPTVQRQASFGFTVDGQRASVCDVLHIPASGMRRPDRPNSRLETAYHHADKAIQTVVDLLAA
jgi:hypothetical protein